MSEINELRFTIFHISGVKNVLSDRGSNFPSGRFNDDKGKSLESTRKSNSNVK